MVATFPSFLCWEDRGLWGRGAAHTHTGVDILRAFAEHVVDCPSFDEHPHCAFRDELIDERLDVGACPRHAVADADNAELGWVVDKVDAVENAEEHVRAFDGIAFSTIGGAVDTGLVVVFFTDVVAADRADTAVSGTAGAVFIWGAVAVAASWAPTAIFGAVEARLGFFVAPLITTSWTDTAVGGTGDAVFSGLWLAVAIATLRAPSAVIGAGDTGLGRVAVAIAAGHTESAISGAGRAALGSIA